MTQQRPIGKAFRSGLVTGLILGFVLTALIAAYYW